MSGLAAWWRMKEAIERILRDRRFHRLAGFVFFLGCCLLLAAWQAGVDVEMALEAWETVRGWLVENPWWLFAALVVLPGLPIPTSALLLLTGTVWTNNPAAGCLIALAGIGLNMSWTHWLSAGLGRSFVAKWLEATNVKLPVLPSGDHFRMTLVVRLTPGIPFFIQNYLLGFFGVPFRVYLPVSLLCNGFFTCAFVLGGAGISSGRIGPAVSGVSVLIVAVIGLRWVRGRMAARRSVA